LIPHFLKPAFRFRLLPFHPNSSFSETIKKKNSKLQQTTQTRTNNTIKQQKHQQRARTRAKKKKNIIKFKIGGRLPKLELNSKLEDMTSQRQDNSILEDGKSSQLKSNLRLEDREFVLARSMKNTLFILNRLSKTNMEGR